MGREKAHIEENVWGIFGPRTSSTAIASAAEAVAEDLATALREAMTPNAIAMEARELASVARAALAYARKRGGV